MTTPHPTPTTRTPGDRARRIAITLAVIASPAVLAGCPGAFIFNPVVVSAPAAVPTAFTVGARIPNGPTVTLVNDSDTPVKIRLWVARIDAFAPAGFVDQHTSDAMTTTVPPGEFRKVQGGEPNWLTGQQDGVVWVKLESPDGVRWFEMERPGPYRIVARRADIDWFEPGPMQYFSTNDRAMTPLPESSWILHHDGEYATSADHDTP